MKTFTVEFDEITTYSGTIEAETLEQAEEIIYARGHLMPNNFEACLGENKIVFIEENKNE